MIRSQLQNSREDDPTWGFVAQLGAEQFTGEVQLGSTPRVRLYVDEGAIYFAERDGDSPLQSRLVVRGALSPAQLARGGVFVDGSASLARLFSRDGSIDRHEVEVAVERITQDVLDEVGPLPVGSVQLTPLRHHDSGIHEWARRIQPPSIAPRFDMPSAAAPLPRPAPPAAPLSISPLTLESVTLESVTVEPVTVEPVSTVEGSTVEGSTVDAMPPPPVPAPISLHPSPPATSEVSPFSAPPVAATAASLPAPSLLAPEPAS